MDVSKYTWMRDGCILVVEISSFKDGVFKTFLKSDEYAKEPKSGIKRHILMQ